MSPFKNIHTYLSGKEFMVALPSVIVGVSILSLPNDVAMVTFYSDGWVSILLAGIICTIFALLAVKVARYFPGQSFFSYTYFLLTRPIAIIISGIFVVIYILESSRIVRSTAHIPQQYLFDKTPMEVLALCFLLVVVYAVSGERLGIFRLNMLFLPIILFTFIFAGIFNFKWFDATNYLPLFKMELTGYVQGVWKSIGTFSGFGIGLFYIAFMRHPKNLTKKVVIGMSVSIVFYLFINNWCFW